MTTELEPIVPRMKAETGYEADDTVASLRPSGFVCLILGIASSSAALGKPLLVIPIAAVLFGAFALRRFDSVTPVGTFAAKLGIVLAVGFGALGFCLPTMKLMTLGGQAERFSRDYIETIALDHNEIAMELKKQYVNRFPESMSLPSHYESSEESRIAFAKFERDGIHVAIRKRGPGAEWKLAAPVDVYYSYGRQHAAVVLQGPSGKPKIQMFLEYHIDRQGNGQWHIPTVQHYRELIVAPVI